MPQPRPPTDIGSQGSLWRVSQSGQSQGPKYSLNWTSFSQNTRAYTFLTVMVESCLHAQGRRLSPM